jgi:hypothetical protein
MRKFVDFQLVLLLMFSSFASAQLYVASNSYVFNKGTLLYVTQDVDLQNNGNLYLRNEGQLLQGTTGSGANKGLGNLSVFQEGTSNNFGYNYWCAPVGVPSAPAGNNSFVLNQSIKRPIGLITNQTPTFISTFDGVSSNSGLTISTYWIYKYSMSNNYFQWNPMGGTGLIGPGEGFTMKGVSGSDNTNVGELTLNNPGNNQRYEFVGKPNDGTITIPVHTAAGQYVNASLTGNPYPSAINLNYFLLENSGYTVNYTTGVYTNPLAPLPAVGVINGTAYFWQHEKPATSHLLAQYIGGYGYYVPNGLTANSPGTYNNATWNTYTLDGSISTTGGATGTDLYKRMFTPVGQGFMVQGTAATSNALMKNIYRVFVKEGSATNSEFERNSSSSQTVNSTNWEDIKNVAGVDYTQFSKQEVPQIKIHTILNNQFSKEITLAFNPNTSDGYDAAMDAPFYGDFARDVFFPINENPYVISTLPFEINKRVPIRFKTDTQIKLSVSVGSLINFDGSDEVFIYDKVTNIYHDIKNSFFEFVLPSGNTGDRYEVTFKQDGALSNNSSSYSSFAVVQNNESQMIKISNPNNLNINSVMVYDVAGKLIFDKGDLKTMQSYEFSSATLSEGVYIVNCKTSEGQTLSEKIIVERVK